MFYTFANPVQTAGQLENFNVLINGRTIKLKPTREIKVEKGMTIGFAPSPPRMFVYRKVRVWLWPWRAEKWFKPWTFEYRIVANRYLVWGADQ